MDSFVGQYVIIRSSPSGCWAGNLKSMEGQTVELTNARRLWRWWAASGVSLSGVATAGLHPKQLDACRIAEPVSSVLVHEVCEVLLATEIAKSSIESQKALAS